MQMSSRTETVLCFTALFKSKGSLSQDYTSKTPPSPSETHTDLDTSPIREAQGPLLTPNNSVLQHQDAVGRTSVYHHYFEEGRISTFDLMLFSELCSPCNIFFWLRLIPCTHICTQTHARVSEGKEKSKRTWDFGNYLLALKSSF